MKDPAPLADFLAGLPFEQLHAFVAPRVPGLPWAAAQGELARLAAPVLLAQTPWDALVATFPGRRDAILGVRERCALAPAAVTEPRAPQIHIGSIAHVGNLAIGNTGVVNQGVGMAPGELDFHLSRVGPTPELHADLDHAARPRDVLVNALAECRDPDKREALYAEAARRGLVVRWDVFLAYATPDRAIADSLADAIARCGRTVFLDHREIPPGALWGAHLQSALLGAQVVVVLLAEGLLTRPYLAHEVQEAVSGGRAHRQTIIPVWKDEPGAAPYGLGAYQALSLRSGLAAVARQIAAACPPLDAGSAPR